jgi:hypothetical protein
MLTGPRQRAILGYVLGSASYVLEIALTPLILPVLRTSFGVRHHFKCATAAMMRDEVR